MSHRIMLLLALLFSYVTVKQLVGVPPFKRRDHRFDFHWGVFFDLSINKKRPAPNSHKCALQLNIIKTPTSAQFLVACKLEKNYAEKTYFL